MRKIKLYIASSLDGFIARPDGGLDWLDNFPNPNKMDYGYNEFLGSVDTTLMGNATYKVVNSFDIPWPYPDKTNYVFTRNSNEKDDGKVHFFSGDVASFVNDLKIAPGKDIWLIGGNQIISILMNAQLIDEFIISIIPVVIGEGIPLFGSCCENTLNLENCIAFETGVVQLVYKKGCSLL